MGNFSKDKIFKFSKGFEGTSRKVRRIAKNSVEKSLAYSYVGRKLKKRDARQRWIMQINAGTKEHELRYSEFTNLMFQDNIRLNRKVLAQIAVEEPFSFRALCEVAKAKKAILNKKPDEFKINKKNGSILAKEKSDARKQALRAERDESINQLNKENYARRNC